jgi:hypothetical protein
MKTQKILLALIVLLITSVSFAQKGDLSTKGSNSSSSAANQTKKKKLIKKEKLSNLSSAEKKLNLIRYLNTSYSLGESIVSSYNSNEKRIFIKSGKKYISMARKTMYNLERTTDWNPRHSQKIRRIISLISSSYSYTNNHRRSGNSKLQEAKNIMNQITPELISREKRGRARKLR